MDALFRHHDITCAAGGEILSEAIVEAIVYRRGCNSSQKQVWLPLLYVVPGVVNDEVIVELSGGNTLTSIITSASGRRLGIRGGMLIAAAIKASSFRHLL